jgi:hypothetical protein
LANHFRTTDTVASEEENELINEVLGYEEQDWKRIRGTVQEPVEYFQVLAKGKSMLSSIGRSKSSVGANSDDEVEGAWGKATAIIDVSADHCLAFFWHHMSYEGNSNFEKKNGRLLRTQVDVPNSNSTFMVTALKSPFPGVDSRIFAPRWAWRREKDGDLVAGFSYKGTPTVPSSIPLPPLSHPFPRRLQRIRRAGHQGRRAGGRLHAGPSSGLLAVHAPPPQLLPRNFRLPDDCGREHPRPGHELRGQVGLG